MEMSISGIIVDVILFFIIAGNAVYGYKMGLVKVAFNIFSTLIAIILVFILYKPTVNYILNNTTIETKIESVFEEKLKHLLQSDNVQSTEQMQDSEKIATLARVFRGNLIGDLVGDTIDTVTRTFSAEIAKKVISIVVFFGLFAIIRLLLYILKNYMDAVGDLPIIRVFNGSGGMIYGIVKGFLLIYVLFAIISIMMPIMNGNIIITSIENAPIGSKMFNNNIILNLIFRF